VIAFAVHPLTIEIREGDLADACADAVVNAANDHLWMGGGVAGALKARGGAEIERAAMAQGPIGVGECVVTSAGALPARYVIHAAVMGQDLRTSAAIIESATGRVLAVADDLRLGSIALPAFGTGVGGFPLDRCARVMCSTIKRAAASMRHLRTVGLVLFGAAAYRAFADAAAEEFDRALERPPDGPVSG
jgi:O-acetyl-ADP-ribose deacetylase (regulator of RNase III)